MSLLPLRKLHVCCIVALALFMQVRFAIAGDTAKARYLSLDSAISMGIKHSHVLEYSTAQVKQAQASMNEVKDLIMPNVDAALGYTRLSNIPVQYFRQLFRGYFRSFFFLCHLTF